MKEQINTGKKRSPGVFSLLKPYKGLVTLLVLFALISNGLNLWLPSLIGQGIDDYNNGSFSFQGMITSFTIVAIVIFIFSCLQSVVQTYASEMVARDLRMRIAEKISRQSFAFIEQANPSKLLTNLTSDVDSIKLFVSQAIVFIYYHWGQCFIAWDQLETGADHHRDYSYHRWGFLPGVTQGKGII
jgi:ATP-binding cassette subfamily B protein